MYQSMKRKISTLYGIINKKIIEQFGCCMHEATFKKLVNYMQAPKDSSSLAVVRIFFGLAMVFDIPDERGGVLMEKRWGDPMTCHFPLLPFILPLPMPYMAIVYAIMWFGAVGIMLGYKFYISSTMFTVSYWYLFLIEKSYWNNHSYLFGLIAMLLSFTQANCYWSIDAYLDPKTLKETVPYWNYFVLKYQFFIVYFVAGLKKGTAEWLTGYSVQNLSEHWVFAPFKLFLTIKQTDYYVVHWFIFVFDLTVSIWMMWSPTRHVAMIFCALFNLMNSRLFRIGMFPWVCLAMMPLFYSFDWPKTVLLTLKEYLKKNIHFITGLMHSININAIIEYNDKNKDINDQDKQETINNSDQILVDEEIEGKTVQETVEDSEKVTNEYDNTEINKEYIEKTEQKSGNIIDTKILRTREINTVMIIMYVIMQACLPFSHFITKGYNNWTNGLYGYSWDMMVHTWDTHSVVVKVMDNDINEEFFIDPYVYTSNDRWTRHGDMIYQYSRCLKQNLDKYSETKQSSVVSKNISVYVDVWCSMNGRFTQRMFDPKMDLLKVSWSPFVEVSFLMPLLDEALHWRNVLDEIRENVHSWSNHSDVIFLADFPGYEQEKYIPIELENVTLTILEGSVVFEPEVTTGYIGQSYQLTSTNRIKIPSGMFHTVKNIGNRPAFYMYTFVNGSLINDNNIKSEMKTNLSVFIELSNRLTKMALFVNLLANNVFRMCSLTTQC